MLKRERESKERWQGKGSLVSTARAMAASLLLSLRCGPRPLERSFIWAGFAGGSSQLFILAATLLMAFGARSGDPISQPCLVPSGLGLGRATWMRPPPCHTSSERKKQLLRPLTPSLLPVLRLCLWGTLGPTRRAHGRPQGNVLQASVGRDNGSLANGGGTSQHFRKEQVRLSLEQNQILPRLSCAMLGL